MLAESSPGYRDELVARADAIEGVRVLPALPMRELVKEANAYDIGLYLLGEANANHRAALPNKFFEFIQARLALAIGPSPEMARIVNEYGLWDRRAGLCAGLAGGGAERARRRGDRRAEGSIARRGARALLRNQPRDSAGPGGRSPTVTSDVAPFPAGAGRAR